MLARTCEYADYVIDGNRTGGVSYFPIFFGIFVRGSLLDIIPCVGVSSTWRQISNRDAMASSPPGDSFVGVPYRDLGEIGVHGYIMLLRDAALPLSQVTDVISRQDPKGNIATIRWNGFCPNGNLVTKC